MSDQLGIFPKSQKELGIEQEQEFLAYIMPRLQAVGADMHISSADITSKVLTSYSSIYFRSSLIAQLNLRRKVKYISIPERISDAIPEGIPTTRTATEKTFLRIQFASMDQAFITKLLEEATRLAIERVPKEFDCCSRYLECSDSKECTHPDPGFSLFCGYRRILNSGRIFYGRNRNV